MERIKSEISNQDHQPQSPKSTSIVNDNNNNDTNQNTFDYNMTINENELNMKDDLIMFLKQHNILIYKYLKRNGHQSRFFIFPLLQSR